MILKYISSGFSLVFISFIVGMLMTALIRKTGFYRTTLSHLNFIKEDRLNNLLGVGVVKWVIKNTFFKFLNQKIKMDTKMSLSDLKNLRNEMTKAEIDHLFAFVFVLGFVAVQLSGQQYLYAAIILFLNLLMNLHPALIQQQNKRRLDRLLVWVSRQKI